MLIAPDANIYDGLLDLIIVKNNINKFALIKLLPKLFTGEHISSQYVEYKQVKSIEIIPEKNECLNIDGEIYGTTPVKVNISNKNYSFKKIVISVGKNITSDLTQKSMVFDKGDYSYVGFFKHKKVHNSIAYEFFKKEGPLAILPAPSPDNNKSTFIYSTNETTTYSKIQSTIKQFFLMWYFLDHIRELNTQTLLRR